jgi:hypothetical protein
MKLLWFELLGLLRLSILRWLLMLLELLHQKLKQKFVPPAPAIDLAVFKSVVSVQLVPFHSSVTAETGGAFHQSIVQKCYWHLLKIHHFYLYLNLATSVQLVPFQDSATANEGVPFSSKT